jgi:FAD/FMN-containing dehydrogenase
VTGDINAGAKGCSFGAYPAYVVNATTSAQISHAVRWADKKNIRLVIKSTGHSYSGRSVGYGSLSIWTHNLRGIKYVEDFKAASCYVDETQTAVRVAAGHSNGDVQTEMAKYNSVIVTGATATVGLVGWLTGGGHGFLSQTYGMGSDNLLEATIVTADGRVHVASPCQNSDLFFAIRGGGGGTYGVITEVVVKTFPTPKTTVHTFKLSALEHATPEEFWEIVAYIHAEFPRLKKGGMQGYCYITGPPTVSSFTFVWTFMLFKRPHGTVETLMATIESRLKAMAHLFHYQSDITHGDTYLEMYLQSAHLEPVATGGSAYGSRLLSPESLADVKITAEAFAEIFSNPEIPSPNATVHPLLLIGHFIAPQAPPTYYPSIISLNPAWRNTLVHLIVAASWQDGSPQAVIDAVYRDITAKTDVLRRLAPETGAYFNEPDYYEEQWQHVFFGENYARLLKVKTRFDPRNLFWCHHCVGSEDVVEWSDGRLCRA